MGDVLNSWPLLVASPFFWDARVVAWSHDNPRSVLSRDWPQPFSHEFTGNRTSLQVWYFFLFWSLVRLNCARNSGVEHWQLSIGLTGKPRALSLITNMHGLWMHQFWNHWSTNFTPILQSPDSAAMFPNRFQGNPDMMWQMGWPSAQMNYPHQFGTGEMMHQQPPAQLPPQNQLDQMQMAQLKEQNSMLKQQLASQAQTHIQHLSQLIPPPQPSPSIPQPTQAHPQVPVPESPTLTSPPTIPPNVDANELLKQVKEVMVTTVKEHQEKPPTATSSQPPVHPGAPPPHQSSQSHQPPPPVPSSSARHRSRSHKPRSPSRKLDKRPISVHRSPRQRRSHRNRSSRPPSRSPSPRRRSSSRRRSPGTSITIRSTSPRRRNRPSTWHEDDFQATSPHHSDTWQPSIKLTSNPHFTPYEDDPQPAQHSTTWKSWQNWKDWSHSYDSTKSTGGWKDYKKSYNPSHKKGQWIDYSKPSFPDDSTYDSSTRPITAFSSEPSHRYRNPKRHQRRSRSAQSRQSTLPPGHVSLDLHGSSLTRWEAAVKFAMDHPDRMPAACEIPDDKRPVATRSIDEDDLRRAVGDLTSLDDRIPTDYAEQAAKLLYSTNLLPDYDLSTCYVLELHAANMIALIMPLPEVSKYRMPPPFGQSKNHTWALIHGTTPSGAQQILLEGKIRPANWTKHPDLRRCELPTFGAFYLGREVANNDLSFPPWALQELLCAADKKGKGQQEFIIGAMYHGAYQHKKLDAGGNEKAMLRVADNGIVVTSEKYTIANSHNVGLQFVAMKWENLTVRPNQITHRHDHDASSEDDVLYRSMRDKRRR